MKAISNEILGLLGTTWAAGFVAAALRHLCWCGASDMSGLFSGFGAIICLNVLVTGMFVHDAAWLTLRAVTGFCTAGTSMIIESWLNERATNESRGAIFSLYIAITLLGVVGGQLMVGVADVTTPILFMVCGVLYCIAILPTTISTAASPQPLKRVSLDLRGLYKNSPVSFVGILMIGIANGAYGTLVAVFGSKGRP